MNPIFKKCCLIFFSISMLFACDIQTKSATPKQPISDKLIVVNEDNFVRALTDQQLQVFVNRFPLLGKLHHLRWMSDLNNQITQRVNLDTIYSFLVADLTSPVTITMPETNGVYQSLMVVSQDHSITTHYTGQHTFSIDSVGTRYAAFVVRTFVDRSNKESLLITHKLQDSIILKQADIGSFSVPRYEPESFKDVNEKILKAGTDRLKLSDGFGHFDQINEENKNYSAAFSWGGLPRKDAIYELGEVSNPDGVTQYSLTVKNVPVDAFWSISVYNQEGYFETSPDGSYAINSTSAIKNEDGSVTVHFGKRGTINNLDIVKNWHYIVRLYQPRSEIIQGQWQFPTPVEIK